MNLAVCLVGYSIAISVLGPPLVASLTRTGAAPRLGVTVWVAAMASVLLAWVGAVALFVARLVDSWDRLGRVLTGCLAGLRMIAMGGYGPVLQAVLLALAGLSVAGLAIGGTRTAAALRRSRHGTRAHAEAVRIAAIDTPARPEGTLVLDHARPAVYCLAGRPSTVVITLAALEALDRSQLGAVMAHEQAHLRGRHHALLSLTTALGSVFAQMRLFRDGAAEVARLLEMCADDAAARRHGRDTLVDALLALALPAAARQESPPPTTALAAADTGVAQRVQRLLFPPNPAPARIRLALVLAALTSYPLLAAGLTAIGPMLPTFCAT